MSRNTTFIVVLISFFSIIHAQTSGLGYSTYHLYTEDESLNDVACSNGANGLETRWGYTTLSPMFPYVSASSIISGWNSPNCGLCIKLINQANTSSSIFVTAVDYCGPPPAGVDAHFDIAKPAFVELFGSTGVFYGNGTSVWSIVDSSNCQGNKGK